MNRNVVTLLCALVLSVAGCGETVELGELEERNGVLYKVNSESGFTGRAVETFWELRLYELGQRVKVKTQKKFEGVYKNGVKNGKVTVWYENGQKSSEGSFSNGLKNGTVTEWDKNGQIRYEGNFKNGKRDGKFTRWHANGKKRFEENYRNGEVINNATWDENGREN